MFQMCKVYSKNVVTANGVVFVSLPIPILGAHRRILRVPNVFLYDGFWSLVILTHTPPSTTLTHQHVSGWLF